MMRLMSLLLAVLLLGSVARTASAVPITFTFTSTNMSGTLGASSFSNETLTVTAIADTANLLNCGGFIAYEAGCNGAGTLAGTFTLGPASGAFDDLLYVFKAGADIGFGLTTGGYDRLTTWILPAFFYDMVSPFGPATSQAGYSMDFSADGTSLGALTASGDLSTVTTFAAVLNSTPSVAEPRVVGLFGLGLLGLLGLAWKRRVSAGM